MWHFIKVYLVVLPVFLAIDYLWLGVLMSGFYKEELGILARRSGENLSPVVWAAGIVYLLIPLGIVLFALPRVSPNNMIMSALFWGFLYGATLYGVYDMTNMALIDKWPLRMSVVDIFWGGIICAVVTCVAAFLDRWFA